MAEAMRVALLARPGSACDKLQAALRQAGAELVHVADPTTGDVAALAAADPAAVLVALEPAVEASLDAFDAVLQDPARITIYDDAEVAATREGWDAARWARHLAAKLSGHGDVLPPGREEDGAQPAVAAPQVPAPPPPEPPSVPEAPPQPEPAVEPEAGLGSSREAESGAGLELSPEAESDTRLELSPKVESGTGPGFSPEAESGTGPEFSPEVESGTGLGFTSEADSGTELEFVPDPEPAAGADPGSVAETRAVTLEYKGGSGLVEDATLEPAPDAAPTSGITLSLEPHGSGGIVVLAGIGGPDAVRQFLGALPEGFPRPVLVRQRLDGGRHDRLVRQLQRATPLPVELALSGSPLAAGHVYILPDDMTTEDDGASKRFAAATGKVGALAGLPPDDSAVVLLSGADPAQVDEVMDCAVAGALVAGQSPEECFDNAAPAAAIARGADAGSPSQLAGLVAGRWNK